MTYEEKQTTVLRWFEDATQDEMNEMLERAGRDFELTVETEDHMSNLENELAERTPQLPIVISPPPDIHHGSVINPPARGITYESLKDVTVTVRRDELETLREKAWMYDDLRG